jgi:arginine decarboxylase
MDNSAVQMSIEKLYCRSRKRKEEWGRLHELTARIKHNEQPEPNSQDNYAVIEEKLREIGEIERYWAFPGRDTVTMMQKLASENSWESLADTALLMARMVATDSYRDGDRADSYKSSKQTRKKLQDEGVTIRSCQARRNKPYFEILVVDSLRLHTEAQIREMHLSHASEDDEFTYDIVVVSSHTEAMIALLLNHNIQSCVMRYSFPYSRGQSISIANIYDGKDDVAIDAGDRITGTEACAELAKAIKKIRPEISCFLLCEATVEDVTEKLHALFSRCFFGTEDYLELRLSILKSVYTRYATPFFDALRAYSRRPSGVFHAMPISRGKSISKSHWINDYGRFCGERMFLSETSATLGGLDSLLKPTGSIKAARETAARTFRSKQTYFVTNGTSTANKIVLQAVTQPGDIVLMSDDCHKSHHYGAQICGTRTIQMSSYRIADHNIVGGISASEVKHKLCSCRDAGQIERVRCVVLTNITFDGIANDLLSIVSESLAIKPDLVFIVDEAWFAYGIATPMTRQRTAMVVANKLREKLESGEYRKRYRQWSEEHGRVSEMNTSRILETKLLPDPDRAVIRVYSTQSTHKTLTALRQGSMIHINDDLWNVGVERSFTEAYQCHTSTSPNYQILASLDIARRQIEIEGYELVQKAFELAEILRSAIRDCSLLSKYFRVLDEEDMIPRKAEKAILSDTTNTDWYWKETELSWMNHEFALDPSRVTLAIRNPTLLTGFRLRSLLMDCYDIQVNKTSSTTILIIIHIGTTRGMVTYLIQSLRDVVQRLITESEVYASRRRNRETCEGNAEGHTQLVPNAARFHQSFIDIVDTDLGAGDTGKATQLAQSEDNVKYVIVNERLIDRVLSGEEVVSAAMVTPYPPGYPILLSGQIVSKSILMYLMSLHGEEVHGYDPSRGLRIYTQSALERVKRY